MRKRFLHLLLIVSMLLPTPAWAGGSVMVDDSIAGLEALADLHGFAPHASLELSIVTPSSQSSVIPLNTNADGSAALSLPAILTEEAGAYKAIVRDAAGAQLAKTGFSVLPGRIDTGLSQVMTNGQSVMPDGRDEVTVTALLQDSFGNALAGRPVQLVSSRSGDQITPLSQETGDDGEQHFAIRTTKPGEMVLRAMDFLSGEMLQQELHVQAISGAVGGTATPRTSYTAQLTGPSPAPAAPATGDFGTLEAFEVMVEPAEAKVNEVLDLIIRAVDERNITVEDYVGSVEVHAPNDPGASLPGFGEGHGTVQFTARDLGRKRVRLSISFSREGEQTLNVIDRSDPENIIQGEVTVLVEGSSEPDASRKIEILSHRDGSQVTGTEILLEGIGPAYSELEVTGGKTPATGETDEDGQFSIAVELDAKLNEFTLRVREQARGYDSGPLKLTRDNVAPALRFHFEPKEPAEDSDVLLVVESEPEMRRVAMEIMGQELSLSERPATPGTYEVLFRAPPAGKYEPLIRATDDAGNVTETKGKLTVGERELPGVRNLTAEPKFSSVDLSWEAPEGEDITSYIVYVSTGSNVYGSSLDTREPRTSVSVMGLKPGQRYLFAVAMKQGTNEGAKSDPVEAIPLGLSLTVTPQDASLLLDWTYPDERVSSFLLQYGVKPDKLTEKRVLDGRLRTFTLRDLFNGVTYYVRLTPIAITGETLSQMAAEGSGTPQGTGFTPGATDPAPQFQPGKPALPFLHSGAPSSPASGLPSVMMVSLAIASALGFAIWYRRKRAHAMTTEFLQAMNAQYRQ